MPFSRSIRFLFASALLVGLPALAATRTATFQVRAEITHDCTIAAADLNFGSIGLVSTSVDATSTLTATCTNTTPYNLGLNAGTVTGSTIENRLMASGPATLRFQLYRDPARAQIWGTTVGTNTQSGTGNGSAQSITVYGRIPSQTPAPTPGVYLTTITVTVTY